MAPFGTGADDRGIGRAFAAVDRETYSRNMAATLVFVLAWRQAFPRRAMGFHADVGGVLNGRDLSRRFFDAQFRDQRRGVGHVAKRIARAQLAGIGFGPRRVDARMGTERQIQLRFELFDRQNFFKTSDRVSIGILGRRALARVSLGAFIVRGRKRISSDGVSSRAAPGWDQPVR